MKIGWIGLGAIGAQMARRLLAAGHDLTAYARGAGLADVEAAGAETSLDYARVAGGRDLLVVCLFNDAQVRDVLFDQGALAAVPAGAVVVIHTTGSPALAREIGERAPHGVSVVDATFSGGPGEVARGELTVMVGGDGDAFGRARPALEAYAGQIHHVGPLGHGQRLKLLNNLLFATNMMNAAELRRLAESEGFEPSVVTEVLQACSGASFAMRLFQKPAPPAAVLAATRPYLEKDVATAMASAAEAGLDVSAFAATAAYFRPA
ncbi:NAD(P)-dependent oxidoreductase [Phenylobacterium sp. LjRoot225]|uniref:NAD(P)-dependent oxidoreductase n=1 Tax=Phenylobacterium sp. LjRoot225 TaxID=3342285 RepID=UPI003ED09049